MADRDGKARRLRWPWLLPFRGWNVWMKVECDSCGQMHKVTSGRPRNRIRQWIVVRFGR